mmetsp:Transcript_8617/g.11372  ORF Transcript_8617/g.11372 Transcript_8617/m.11372 type:complete len:89 (+) Transcript_8617:1242-1508(+)
MKCSLKGFVLSLLYLIEEHGGGLTLIGWFPKMVRYGIFIGTLNKMFLRLITFIIGVFVVDNLEGNIFEWSFGGSQNGIGWKFLIGRKE